MKSLLRIQIPSAFRTAALLAVLAVPALSTVGQAQTIADHIAAGDKALAERKGDEALKAYEEALKIDSLNPVALEKATTTLVMLAEFGSTTIPKRQTLFAASRYAVRLHKKDSTKAGANFALAQSIAVSEDGGNMNGQNALLIKTYIKRCLAKDPKHPGCAHLFGMWNANFVRMDTTKQKQMRYRVTGLTGGFDIFEDANWENAVKNMQIAVAAEPNRIYHRLKLGQIYADMGEKEKARVEFKFVESAPAAELNDEKYKEIAAQALKDLDAQQPQSGS